MMNMNKWTMALAAAGVVSLSSVAQAQEAAAGADVVAASVELSGYVSSSYTIGSNRSGNTFRSTDAQSDKFSLDVVSLSLNGAKGEGEWASGYNFTMWVGDAASDIGTGTNASQGTLEVMEANIDLTLPVGDGINLTVGQMGTVVGYESYDYTDNVFHNRGWAFAAEPTHHTGVLAEYQMSDNLGIKAGVANDTTSAVTNNTADDGAVAYLLGADYAPSEGTWLGDNGFDLSLGAVLGAGADATERDTIYGEVGLPIEGMVANLTADVAATYVEQGQSDTEIYQVYLAYSLSDNTTINARYEFGDDDITSSKSGIESYAIGVTHKLWENVTSRIEYMTSDWDGAANDDEALTVSLIYSF